MKYNYNLTNKLTHFLYSVYSNALSNKLKINAFSVGNICFLKF